MKYQLTLLACFICLTNIFAQSDVKNSKDYYLLDRLPEYDIIKYSELEFDTYDFYIDKKKVYKEGKKISIEYKHQKSTETDFIFPTRLQVLRNYSNAIKKAGGQIVFERHNAEYGQYTFKTDNSKEIWIEVKPKSSGKSYVITIIEVESMRQDIVIDADLIKNKIEIEGKIAIYGIYFDTGKAILKDESQPALEQIAEFLKVNPSINCWIVGHTDSDGSFQLNSKLSLDRAVAVKLQLQNNFGISSNRLFAEGVGPLAPVASNTTEEGKKLNRRVELVKK